MSDKPKRAYTRKPSVTISATPEVTEVVKHFGEELEKSDFYRKPEPEPERTTESGDKTPEYMRWFLETHGEDAFNAKYGQRKCPELE